MATIRRRATVVLAVVGVACVAAACSSSGPKHYRDDRSKVTAQIASLGKQLHDTGYLTTVPMVHLGGCRFDHYAAVQWSATIVGSLAASPIYDRSRGIANTANVAIDLGVKHFVTTTTGSLAEVFATSDAKTQLIVTTTGVTARVDGFASC